MFDDTRAYLEYPKLRHFYNKLWLSEKLGYYCGPGGIAPQKSGFYIVRPVMNLRGMGVGSSKEWIVSGDKTKVHPSSFWCEFFEGRHLSVTYEKINSDYKIKHCYEGFKDYTGRFIEWKKVNDKLELPKWIKKSLVSHNIPTCNAEFIGENLIELHLRDTPDPIVDSMFPIWKGDNITIDKLSRLGYSYITSYDDADGFLKKPRLGFMIKDLNKKRYSND